MLLRALCSEWYIGGTCAVEGEGEGEGEGGGGGR